MSTRSTRRPKASVRRNRWGNWRGYIGGRYVREFAADVCGPLVGTTTTMMDAGNEMPAEAREWLAGLGVKVG